MQQVLEKLPLPSASICLRGLLAEPRVRLKGPPVVICF